jgi:hypothetical protein
MIANLAGMDSSTAKKPRTPVRAGRVDQRAVASGEHGSLGYKLVALQ